MFWKNQWEKLLGCALCNGYGELPAPISFGKVICTTEINKFDGEICIPSKEKALLLFLFLFRFEDASFELV
jgi:hypothetical protein